MHSLTRRHFLYSAGVSLTAVQANRVMGANDRIRMGIVGLGGRGQAHLGMYGSIADCDIAAVCDVNQAARERAVVMVAKTSQKQPKEYIDMREMFADKNIDAVSAAVQNYKGTLLAGVPSLYRLILENERFDFYNLKSLRYCWSAGDALPSEVATRWREKVGIPIYQVYGSTECVCISVTSPVHEISPRTTFSSLTYTRNGQLPG